MARQEEFDFGKAPETWYHGGMNLDKIIAESGFYGHVTVHPDLAAGYATPHLYEIRKHPAMKIADAWDPKDVLSTEDEPIPASHIKRVGHVILHQNDDSSWGDETHWHKQEDCPGGFDTTWNKGQDNPAGFNVVNKRAHPTDPNKIVADFKKFEWE